uniref:molybdenum cofactor guanylyltransferase n=1 Tax=Pseudomonas sp. RIT-PI-S TaxID=3035295 RepID=UPI0021D9D0D3
AGGQGARVGGQDKGLLTWQGAPMIAHLHALVRLLTDDLIISCNRNADCYAPYADQLAADSEPGFPGPMAGLRAGLARARYARLLVLPCDVPGLDAELITRMLALHAQAPEVPLIIRQGGAWEPLLCVLPCSARAAFETAWANGERSPRRVLLALQPQALDCPEGDPRLRNFNTLTLINGGALE